MLSALDENGRLVSLLDGIPANQNFVCPACRSAVRLKNGKVMRPHFAHVSLDKCDFYSENESSEHLQLKAALYHAVSRTEQVVVEKVLPDLHQVADLFVNDNLALEVQCSRLSESWYSSTLVVGGKVVAWQSFITFATSFSLFFAEYGLSFVGVGCHKTTHSFTLFNL